MRNEEERDLREGQSAEHAAGMFSSKTPPSIDACNSHFPALVGYGIAISSAWGVVPAAAPPLGPRSSISADSTSAKVDTGSRGSSGGKYSSCCQGSTSNSMAVHSRRIGRASWGYKGPPGITKGRLRLQRASGCYTRVWVRVTAEQCCNTSPLLLCLDECRRGFARAAAGGSLPVLTRLEGRYSFPSAAMTQTFGTLAVAPPLPEGGAPAAAADLCRWPVRAAGAATPDDGSTWGRRTLIRSLDSATPHALDAQALIAMRSGYDPACGPSRW
jgi:hypothetical protein